MDIVSTKQINSRATDNMCTASINCHRKRVRDCYILHTVLLAIILLWWLLLFAVIMQSKKSIDELTI